MTGVLQSNINLSNCPNPCSFFDPPGGISNDGTDLIVYNSNWNQAVYIDTFGERVEERFPFANSIDGGEAVAYRADGNQLFAADNGDIVRYVSEGNDLFVADEFDVSATMTNIRGMVFDGGTAGVPQDDVLYMADSGNIYKAGVPSAVTNDPLGMTYDSIADELYVLVDGKGKSDHVVVVDPNTGTLIRDFQTPNENGYAITYLNGAVYVSSDDPFGPCCGPPPRFIHVLDPNDGTELNSLSADDLPGRIYGMANDGTSLIVAPEHGGAHVELLDPNSGFTQGDVFFFDPFSGFFQEGFEALAYDSSGDPEYLPVKFDIVYRFNEHGRLIEEFDIGATGISGIRGATFVGNLLYVAEQGTNTVRSAAVPLPPTVITSDPKGMTTDGTDLYVVVDGEPRDKILKLDAATGQLVTSFGDQGAMDSPGTDTDGIVYHNGLVYLVTNDESFFTDQFSGFVDIRPIIYDIDPITGDILNNFDITEENQFGPPFPIHDPVGSLASDGVFLYAGVKGEFGIVGEWMKIDPNNPFAPVQFVEEFAGFLPFMEGFHSMVIVQGSQFSPNKELVASGNTFFGGPADVIARFDKESGAMSGQFNMSGRDIKGMTYMGLTLFMADDATNSILGTALPENTVELTIVNTGGEPTYDATLIADVEDGGNPGVLIQTFSSTVQFTIVRNPNVVLTMDSPVDGFVVTTTTTTISGRVNDPSIDEVEVGIQLPFTLFVDDNVALSTSEGLWDIDSSQSNGPLWHVSCQDSFSPTKVSSPICSWRYANPGQGNFQTGSPDINTSGSLAMVDTAEVNPGTELEFFTGYATELHADIDRKVIEVAVVTTDLQGNDVVGQFQPIAQIVGQGVGFAPHPFNAHPSFHYIELEPLFINPNLAHVVVNLSPFAGDRVKVRFLFDAVDGFANEGEGWYLDDIRVAGAGVKSIVIPTIPMTPPVQDGGEIYYRSFSTPFELAEGQNLAGSFAQQPYSPFNSLLVLVTGFVDQTAPNLTLFGLPAATSNLLQTLEGNIDDATFQSLEITHTNANGSQVIFSLSSMPTEGDFSSPVSLIEGVNTFDAVAIDGGGLQSLESLQVIADITPPTASVKIVTVSSEGEAVLGDQYFVVVAASDNLSGVASVLDVTSGDAMAPVGEVPTILVVMHDLGDVSGTSATHVQLATVQAGTPVGQNQINITVVDGAGNQSSVAGTIDVVSARSNRNFFLFPGVNFARLALIPDDGNPITTDDDSLDRLMTQDVTSSVNPALATALGGTVTLGDVMESTFGYNDFGNFILHTPGSGGAADTLTVLDPFQGMIMKTLETTNVGGTDFDVFSKVSVEGFSAQQSVPIRMNIEGVFFRPGELPPDKTMRVGYNLIAPHILEDTLFDTVYRGALIPQQLAVSAITFERRVDAGNDALTIEAEIFEGFVTNSLGNLLKPVISYWTFVVQDSPTNPSTPTITP